jgi:hypothetical protein
MENCKGEKYFQQGDVLLFAVAELPQGKKLKTKVVRQGETHHSHVATGDATIIDHEGTLFLSVGEKGATITHEEHKAITLPEGKYRIGYVQEFDYDKQEKQNVRD